MEIPKASGGTRLLGILTVADHFAQKVFRRYLEPLLESVFFQADSYGYDADVSRLTRSGQRASGAGVTTGSPISTSKVSLTASTGNCVLRAVRKHTDCRWVLLYIERSLKSPAVMMENGTPFIGGSLWLVSLDRT